MKTYVSKNVSVESAREDIVDILFYEKNGKSMIRVEIKNGSTWYYELTSRPDISCTIIGGE